MSKIEMSKLEAAINTVAEFFNEPITGFRGTVYNELGFQQANVLTQLRVNAVYMAQSNEDYVAKIRGQVDEQLRSADGTEIKIEVIAKLKRSLERALFQQSAIAAFKSVVETVYDANVERPFEMPKRKAATPSVSSADQREQMLADLAALGCSVPSELPWTPTIDEASDETPRKAPKAKRKAA